MIELWTCSLWPPETLRIAWSFFLKSQLHWEALFYADNSHGKKDKVINCQDVKEEQDYRKNTKCSKCKKEKKNEWESSLGRKAWALGKAKSKRLESFPKQGIIINTLTP